MKRHLGSVLLFQGQVGLGSRRSSKRLGTPGEVPVPEASAGSILGCGRRRGGRTSQWGRLVHHRT